MNTSQFMDKQILDLMNPQEESSSNPHRISSSSNGEDAARDREEMVPSYDFQPIRTTTAAASAGGICTGVGGGGSGPAWGSLDSRLGSSNLRSAGLLEPQVLTEIKQPHKEERSPPAVSITEIDRTVKKYADTVLHALEGVSARLAQLESRTHHVESAVDDLRNVVGDYNGSNDGKLRHFENILREVQSGVQILRDKQEIVETQMQLSKMSPPSKPMSSSDPTPSDISQTQTQPQQQLALPAPIPPQYAPQIPQPNPPPPPPPSQYAPQMPPQTTPNAPPPPPPQYQPAPNMPPQYPPPQTQSAPNAPPPPPPSQYAPQMPHKPAPIPPQYPPQSLQSTPSVPPYFPSQPNQQVQAPPPYTTLSQLHQEELNSSPNHNAPPPPYMQQPPQTYPPRGPSPPYMQQQQQQQPGGPTYSPPPPAMYINEPRPNYDSSYPYGGGSPSYRMNKPNNNNSSPFSSGGLPTAKILPQAAGPVGSGSGGRVAIDDVVEKVAMMGFSREQVRGTVRKLTENGQNVDLNVVLDKLMNDGDIIQPNKASWFNR